MASAWRAVALHCTFFAADGKRIVWEGLAAGSRGKQQEFKLSAPAGDVPGDTRAVFRTAEGATASIPGIVAPQETGDKVWAKAGNVGDALVVQLLLKKQDSGLWRTKKLVVTTPEPASQAAAAAPSRPPRVTCADEEMGNEMLLCARYGEIEDMVAILDENVVPVDYQNDGLNTALHYVSANGNLECIRELLRRGARSLANSSGNTPLHWAVQNKQLDATKELLANSPGCDVLQKNDFGRSSLTEAFQTDNAQILEVVLGHSSAAALENPGGGVVEEETDEQVDEGAEGEGAPAGAAEDKMVIE